MSFSLYHAVVPAWVQVLPAIAGCLDKAEAHCRDNGIAPSELLEARLAPDMWDFTTQIRTVATHSAGALAGALSGDFVPFFEASPADFGGLKAVLDDALAKVSAARPADVDALTGRDVVFRFGERRMDFIAEDFLTSFALPNFYFHASTAYAILRMKGVAVGKMDFLGRVRFKTPVA